MARSITAGGFGRSDRAIMLAAILLAAIAAVLVFIAANSGDDGGTTKTADPIVGGVSVVTAVNNISANTTITEDMLQVTQLPAAAILAQAYTAPEGLVGLSLRYPVLAGEQITPNKVGESVEDDKSVSLLVRPGNRAIGIPISEESAVGGLLLPGDFVDVIALFNDSETGIPKAVTIVQNVEVLGVAQDIQDAIPRSSSGEDAGGTYGEVPSDAEANADARSVTLSVTPEQAQLLALTAKEATLWTVARPRGDTTPVELGESNLIPFQTEDTDTGSAEG